VLIAAKFGGSVEALQTVIKLSDVRQSRVVVHPRMRHYRGRIKRGLEF